MNPDTVAYPRHTRTVTGTGFLRDDNLWDIEMELIDVKHQDYCLLTGLRPQGTPIHHMKLRITIDDEMTVTHATAQMLATPFPGHCENIVPDYQQLVGLNLMRNFRHDVARIFGAIHGCTHLSELAQHLPTHAAIFLGPMEQCCTKTLCQGQKTAVTPPHHQMDIPSSHSSKGAAPLNPDTVAHPRHTRTVTGTGFLRDDNLWDIEMELIDAKHQDYPLPTGLRSQGTPIHHMKLRVTIDDEMTISHATAQMLATPFSGPCENIVPDYQQLVGLNLMRNFRHDMARIFDAIHGCTHLSELAHYLPTTAFQTVIGKRRRHQSPETPPKPLNGCHVWDERSAMIQTYFPRWYRPSSSVTKKEST